MCADPDLWSGRIQRGLVRISNVALEVQRLLADRGQHRGPSIPDLIIAASAELSGMHVLHVDKELDTISALTGQPTTRLDCVADK